ncbi:dynein regulatory complex subunit 2 isoform X2 [Syngnathus typhle]|uniref:dynein regulatory complex subunit 2 isoform X2 n=1 Tax=Syngnathus typhle TaxID=161592 RepID=UPI002A6B8FD0|nr:dynein regulatory complex subunit 2 isoform X2 [Syngnathus typhle]
MFRQAKKVGGVAELPQRWDRAKQEEVERKREELLTLFLTVKVHREEQNSCVNRAKLDQAWRVILQRARSEQLRHDIIVLRQTLERQLDGLDDIIKVLSGDLEEAERQCCRVRRLHLHHAERLRTLLEERVASVRIHWEQNMQYIDQGFAEDSNNMAVESQHQRRSLEDAALTSRRHDDVMRQVHAVYGDIMAAQRDAQCERVSALCRADEKMEEKRHQKQELEEVKQKVEQACRPAQLLMSRNLMNDTGKDVTRVRRLQVTRWRAFSSQGASPQSHNPHLQVAVSSLCAQLSAFQTETTSDAEALMLASTEVAAMATRLGRHLTEARRASGKRLSVLALQTDAAAHKLRALVDKGEKVLLATSLCSQLELATTWWPSNGKDDEHPTKTRPTEMSRLLNWDLLQQEALAKRSEDLRRNNRRLRLLLRRCLHGAVLGGGPAHVAIEAAPVARANPVGTSRHNIIEANAVVRNSLT